jgi:hypothetical protein
MDIFLKSCGPGVTISICHYRLNVYISQVRIHGIILRLALVALFGVLFTGCSGINTGTTVSPASFFLPGILQADPPKDGGKLQAAPEPVVIVAQVR